MNDTTDSERLATIIRVLQSMGPAPGVSRGLIEQHITLARSAIRSLDQHSLLQRVARLHDQVHIITRLQDLAYYDPDSGGIPDIAQWCVRQWLRLLQQHTEHVDVLRGLGQAWLLRSQTSLAKIQIEEGSSNGSHDSVDDAANITHAAREANSRRHTAHYVEARGTLIPATEYLTRAVNIAEQEGVLEGRLLCLAAEAHMSLGNVSYTPANEQQFRQALIYLRRASQIQGYALPQYLQQYLDDYGRLLDF